MIQFGYLRMELKRVLREPTTMMFVVVLPTVFYLLFGAAASYSRDIYGHGNLAFYVLTGMAGYGVATATSGIGGRAAVERAQGWGRQLGLTPMTDAQYVATKTVLAMTMATLPIAATYLVGALTGARADTSTWVISAVVLEVGSVIWALYGLSFGLAFRSDAAVSASSGLLVVLALLGNVFIPLSGVLLTIARFTPMYGYIALARYPQTRGQLGDADGQPAGHENVWLPIANVLVWTLIMAVSAVSLVRRGRSRQ